MITATTKTYLILLKVLFIAAFFPYVKIIDFPTDTQPYAFLFSLVVIALFSDFKAPKYFQHYIYFILLFAPIIGLYSGLNLIFIRSFVGYLSFFTISWASFILFKKVEISRDLFTKIVIIWFIVGFIQMFILPQFGSALISGFRTTEERGVVSLAPESSYYGIICLTFLLFNVVIYRSRLVYFLCLIQIVIFSQSFMVMAYLMLFLYFLMLSRSNLKRKIILLTLPFISFYLLSIVFPIIESESNSRALKLLSFVIESPFQLFKLDASANDRLAHIFYSIKGAVDNYLLPNGFSKWPEYITGQVQESNFFWWFSSGRIMSTYGSAIFELGILGVALPITINYVIFKKRKILENKSVFLFLFLNVFLLGAIPLAYPPLGIMIGYLMSLNENKQT